MTYEDDERMERLLEALAYQAARAEEDVLTAAEASLAATPDFTSAPMPNTAHPSLKRYAGAVRSADPRMRHLRIPQPRPMVAFEKTEPLEIASLDLNVITLTAKKVAAPAPFVNIRPFLGQQAMYVWWAWVDDLGRHIATDCELVWRY